MLDQFIPRFAPAAERTIDLAPRAVAGGETVYSLSKSGLAKEFALGNVARLGNALALFSLAADVLQFIQNNYKPIDALRESQGLAGPNSGLPATQLTGDDLRNYQRGGLISSQLSGIAPAGATAIYVNYYRKNNINPGAVVYTSAAISGGDAWRIGRGPLNAYVCEQSLIIYRNGFAVREDFSALADNCVGLFGQSDFYVTSIQFTKADGTITEIKPSDPTEILPDQQSAKPLPSTAFIPSTTSPESPPFAEPVAPPEVLPIAPTGPKTAPAERPQQVPIAPANPAPITAPRPTAPEKPNPTPTAPPGVLPVPIPEQTPVIIDPTTGKPIVIPIQTPTSPNPNTQTPAKPNPSPVPGPILLPNPNPLTGGQPIALPPGLLDPIIQRIINDITQTAPVFQIPPRGDNCVTVDDLKDLKCNFSDCSPVSLCEPERIWLERAGGTVYSGSNTLRTCEKLFPDQLPELQTWEEFGPAAILQAIDAQNQAIDRVLQWICKLADQEPALAVPEWWPILRTPQRRQMVIAYRTRLPDGSLGKANRQITIPHYAGTGAPTAPTYTAGPYYALAILTDNSKIHVYGNTEQEARRVCEICLGQVAAEYRFNVTIRSGQVSGRQVDVAQRIPYRWFLWPSGQEGGSAAASGIF